MHTQNAPLRGDPTRPCDASGQRSWCERLAARLDALRLRAASEDWPGWTGGDAATLDEAAREISVLSSLLAHEAWGGRGPGRA